MSENISLDQIDKAPTDIPGEGKKDGKIPRFSGRFRLLDDSERGTFFSSENTGVFEVVEVHGAAQLG